MGYIYSKEIVGAYKTSTESFDGNEVIKRIDEDSDSISWIPIDENNTDYQAYLLWLEEQE